MNLKKFNFKRQIERFNSAFFIKSRRFVVWQSSKQMHSVFLGLQTSTACYFAAELFEKFTQASHFEINPYFLCVTVCLSVIGLLHDLITSDHLIWHVYRAMVYAMFYMQLTLGTPLQAIEAYFTWQISDTILGWGQVFFEKMFKD